MVTPKRNKEWVAQMDMQPNKLYVHRDDRKSMYRKLEGKSLQKFDSATGKWEYVNNMYYIGKEKCYREY